MKEKTDNNSMSLKWEQNGELAHKDLSELIEKLSRMREELLTILQDSDFFMEEQLNFGNC